MRPAYGGKRMPVRHRTRPDARTGMRRRSAEDIVAKLRQADFFMAQGRAGTEVAQAVGVMQTLYRDKEFQEAAQQDSGTARLEELQAENARLRKIVADLRSEEHTSELHH